VVPLSSGTRRGSGGKLTDVLGHTLRIGDTKVSDAIIAAYKERGLVAPEHLEEPPAIESRFFVYWEAYQDLQTERHTPRGRIPVNAILDYADRYGIDRDRLKRIIWQVDKVLLEFWKSKDEAEKRQRELEKASQPRPAVGGRT
jgi:hypothetical protein